MSGTFPHTGYRNSGDMQSRVPVLSLYSPRPGGSVMVFSEDLKGFSTISLVGAHLPPYLSGYLGEAGYLGSYKYSYNVLSYVIT